MHMIDLMGLLLYFAILLYIGYRSAKKTSSSADFAVAGNKIIWPVLFATLAASFLGGGASMGRAGKAFDEGYAFMFAASAFPIATIIAGLYIAPRLKRYAGAQTVGDIMAHHYGRSARLLTGIFSLIFCVGILGAQALAIGTVFNAILGIEISTGILIGMAVVLVYSTAGGMWAVIQTDVVQFVMLAVFLPITMIVGLDKIGGPDALIAALPTEVVRLSEVAGQGPPWTIAWQTSTPVGQPLARIRPALRSSTGIRLRAASISASSRCRVAVSWPSRCSQTARISSRSRQAMTSELAPKTSSCNAASLRKSLPVVRNSAV